MPTIFLLEQEEFFEPVLISLFGETFGIESFTSFNSLNEQINQADLILIDERFLDDPLYQQHHDIFQQISSKAYDEFINIVLLTRKLGLTQKQLDRLYDYCDDNFSIASTEKDIIKKIYHLLKRKKQSDILKQSLQETGNLVHSALQLSGDLGEIFHFFQKHTVFENLQEFIDDFLEVLSNYRFKAIIRIVDPNNSIIYATNTERVSELDQQIMESHVCENRFVEFGVRIQINMEKISILIKNLPSKDDYQVTRIKDNMVYLLNTANHLLKLYEGRLEKKELMKKVKRSLIKLEEEKNKAEAATLSKSNFLANMSHEIRTPMNAIIGMTHLAMQTDLNEKQQNYIQKAHSSAESLLGIINDILDHSKIESGKMELETVSFKLTDVITNMMNLVKFKAEEKSLELSIDIAKNIPKNLKGDPLRLGQVLINLCNNAVKFSDSGGSVQLKINLKDIAKGHAFIHFMIIDKGIGMTDEQQQKLFQSFSQADSSTTRKYGGTGLGLNISKQIIELMNGNIWVESESEKGSIFHFVLPLEILPDDYNFELDNPKSDIDLFKVTQQLKGSKVLLVEDNEINQELAMELLMMNQITVMTAYNGEEALEMLAEQQFDGILMDCQMPVMDGFEATLKIRQQAQFKDIPIIAMTANAMKADVQKVIMVGMNDHIAKPINPEIMLKTMAKWINKK